MICKAVLRNVLNFPICAHIILFSKEYEKDKKTHNIHLPGYMEHRCLYFLFYIDACTEPL